MKKTIRLTESDLKRVIKKILNEQSIPGGISQQAFDEIMAISKKNKASYRGSYLFPAQQSEIDKKFGVGTYGKFFKNGGEQMLMKPETAPLPKTPVAAAAAVPNTATAGNLPFELKNKAGVMAFQDWLDSHVKGGWAKGYKNNIINKGKNGPGYGTYGPRTAAAWGKYKPFYLKQNAIRPIA